MFAFRTSILLLAVFSVLATTQADELQQVEAADAGLFARLDASGDGLVTADEVDTANSRLFKRLVRIGDANGDGKLTREELVDALQVQREPKPLTEESGYSNNPAGLAAKALLLTLDTNPDGVIRRTEVPEQYKRAFDAIAAKADTNKNKVIDPLELARGGPQVMREAVRVSGRLRFNSERVVKEFQREQGALANRFDESPNPQQMLATEQGRKTLFATLDRNGDKQIALSELPQQGPGNVQRLFRFGDTNRDEKLSESEFRRAAEQVSRFTRASENNGQGGKAKKPEVSERSTRLANSIVDAIVKRLDKNGDGQLSASEITGNAAERIKRADLDGSGAIDTDEIEAMKGYMAERIEEGGANSPRQFLRRLGGSS